MPKRPSTWLIVILAGLAVLPATAGAEARTFGLATYTVPDGWKHEDTGRGLVTVSRLDTDKYCLVAIYGPQPASGDLAASFAGQWQNVAVQTIDPIPAPTPTLGDVGNAHAAIGGAPATIKGKPAIIMLFVLDAGASVVPIVVVSSSMEAFQTYSDDVKALLGSLVVQRAGAPAAQPAPAPPPGDGKLVIPPPGRAITLADLAGDWQHEDRISTSYVDRYSGAYAGSDNLAMRDTWTITAKGAITSHFFAIRNGKKFLEDTSGTIKVIGGRIIDIKMGAGPQYVLRGWLDLPAMTIMKICGPFYNGEIPQDILDDPNKGANLDGLYVRKKAPPPPK